MNSHSSRGHRLLLALTLIVACALPQLVQAQTPTVGVTQFIPSVKGGICGFQITFDPSGSTAAYAQITVGAVSGSPVGLSPATLHVWTTDTTYSVPSPTSSGNVWNVYKGTPAGQPYSVIVQVVQTPTTPLPGSATYATGPITSTSKTGPVVGTAIQLQTMSFESTVNSATLSINVTMNGGGGGR